MKGVTMKARKIISVLIILCLVLAMPLTVAGCGNSGGNTGNTGNTGNKNPLKVGVKSDVLGFGFKDPASGKYEGMEIELAEMIAKELGYNGVEYTAVTAATRTELLDSGDLDCVLATFTITEERKKSWDFSTPYYTDAVTVLVEKSSGIKNLNDLVGKKIGVSTGSTSAFALVNAMAAKGLFPGYTPPASSKDFDISSFNQAGTTFQQFSDYPAVSNALTAGTVNAFCVDKSILAYYATDSRVFIEEKFSPQNYGVATKKDSDLSKKIDDLIVKWLADGTIDKLIAKYKIG